MKEKQPRIFFLSDDPKYRFESFVTVDDHEGVIDNLKFNFSIERWIYRVGIVAFAITTCLAAYYPECGL